MSTGRILPRSWLIKIIAHRQEGERKFGPKVDRCVASTHTHLRHCDEVDGSAPWPAKLAADFLWPALGRHGSDTFLGCLAQFVQLASCCTLLLESAPASQPTNPCQFPCLLSHQVGTASGFSPRAAYLKSSPRSSVKLFPPAHHSIFSPSVQCHPSPFSIYSSGLLPTLSP